MEKILITGGNGFIGTNLLLSIRERSEAESIRVHIIDIKPPQIKLKNNEVWINLDILNREDLIKTFIDVSPDFVIHLAAETDCNPNFTLDNYLVNTKGSVNVFDASEVANVAFLINTSTQYVNQSGAFPVTDDDYAPHTVYGESKAIAETSLREGPYSFNWVIIRPTNVWGRWHLRYPYEFWKIVRDGKYFHPGSKVVMRSYGYVGNVCEQILKLIDLRDSQSVSKKIFYVGDEPINLYNWVNSFSLAITKKKARIVPTAVVYSLAVFGSILQKLKVSFPITISRYKSMTSENPAPMEKTIKILGCPKYSMQQGVEITTTWLSEFWKTNKV